jgi:hypothetical protein
MGVFKYPLAVYLSKEIVKYSFMIMNDCPCKRMDFLRFLTEATEVRFLPDLSIFVLIQTILLYQKASS